MANQANFPPFKSDNHFRIIKTHRHVPLGREEGKTGSSRDGSMGRKTNSPPPCNCQESHESTLSWRVLSTAAQRLKRPLAFGPLNRQEGSEVSKSTRKNCNVHTSGTWSFESSPTEFLPFYMNPGGWRIRPRSPIKSAQIELPIVGAGLGHVQTSSAFSAKVNRRIGAERRVLCHQR